MQGLRRVVDQDRIVGDRYGDLLEFSGDGGASFYCSELL